MEVEPGGSTLLEASYLQESPQLSGKERRKTWLNRPRDRKKAVRGETSAYFFRLNSNGDGCSDPKEGGNSCSKGSYGGHYRS